jgi:phosphatidylinositol alpha-1,6-mannosyltransferase
MEIWRLDPRGAEARQSIMKQKSILIPAYDFKPLLGGVANYGHELAVQFSKCARVHVVSRKLPGMEEFDQNLPYEITRIRTPYSGLGSYPLFARAMRRIIRRDPPDVIFCLMWFPDAAASRLAMKPAAIPYFVAAHGTEVFDDYSSLERGVKTVLLKRLRARVFRGADKVFPVSHYTRTAILDRAPGHPEKVITVNNGVNAGIFKTTPVPSAVESKYRAPAEKILLTVTRLYPYKGVDRMLESLPAISRAIPGIKYLVVGEGPDLPRLRQMTTRLGLDSTVRFLGRLQLSEIVQLYNLADLFVMLSREEPPDVEGFGLVFLEAAACGLPSVGGRSGGIPDAIDDGKTGWLVDPRNTDEIAATIIDVFTSPDKLERASELCLATAPEKSWERVAENILSEMFADRPERNRP